MVVEVMVEEEEVEVEEGVATAPNSALLQTLVTGRIRMLDPPTEC